MIRSNRLPSHVAAMIGVLLALPAVAGASRTEGPPVIRGLHAHLTASSVTLRARVKPDGRETHYELMVSRCPEPGVEECPEPSFRTVAEGTIPAASRVRVVEATVALDELELVPSKTYPYLLVARNVNGEVAEASNTFKTRA